MTSLGLVIRNYLKVPSRTVQSTGESRIFDESHRRELTSSVSHGGGVVAILRFCRGQLSERLQPTAPKLGTGDGNRPRVIFAVISSVTGYRPPPTCQHTTRRCVREPTKLSRSWSDVRRRMAVSGWLGFHADIWTGWCRVSGSGRPNTLSELEIVACRRNSAKSWSGPPEANPNGAPQQVAVA